MNNGAAKLTFDSSANRLAPSPLAISTDEVGVADATFAVGVNMPATTFTIEFDTAVGSAPDAFAIPSLPTL